MSLSHELKIINSDGIPKMAIGILAAIALFSLFVVGYDQGQIFSLVQGNNAYGGMWLHEFTHDIRHAAGFPCH